MEPKLGFPSALWPSLATLDTLRSGSFLALFRVTKKANEDLPDLWLYYYRIPYSHLALINSSDFFKATWPNSNLASH